MLLEEDKTAITEAYGKENWGGLPNFTGGYINYGYWADILGIDERRLISYAERVSSSKAMYDKILEDLILKPSDVVMEIGCGTGMGANHVSLHYDIKKIIGVDITKEQIEIARLLQQHNILRKDKLLFINEEASIINLQPVDKIYSVEALQHFPKILPAMQNMYNLLKEGGRIAIATFFLKKHLTEKEVINIFPLVSKKQEYLVTIDEVVEAIKIVGFKNAFVKSIGAHVFHGYQKWIRQCNVNTQCSYVYDEAFCNGYIDYFIVYANKG